MLVDTYARSLPWKLTKGYLCRGFLGCLFQGDTLDYLGIPGLHIAGAQGILVIAFCQVILMVNLSYPVL
jgi:hypothetical protein